METGIGFTTVLIGLFAIGEVLDQLSVKGKQEIISRLRPKTTLPSLKDLWNLRNTILRGLGIGVVIGAIPGTGATVASFISYGVEKQVSKHPEKFGTGVWEGLAASETAINGSTGGAMIPLLTLGIPGSGATAVMMGAFLLHGIQPGPLLFAKSPEAVYTIFAGMLVCNLIMILAGLVTARFFSELMRVPEDMLSAFIISFCLLGAFALRNDMSDVWFMVIFGIIGYFMRRFDIPSAPMILGLILGPLAERYFITSIIAAGNDFTIFFRRPMSGTIMVISICLLIMPFIRGLIKKGKKSPEEAA
jgi:putative tricarboxylic transport membrane protein